MAGLYALAAAFFASFSVVYVLVCTFTPFLECGWLIDARLPSSLAFCIRYYNYTTRRARGAGNVAARVEGRDRAAKKSNVPGLQRLARHAHQVLAQPVRVRLPAQPWRRTRSRSLLRQHFLHYFSVEIPRGERAARTSEKASSTHSGE